MEVLATPSADVQTAVSACLTPLMPGLAADRGFTDGLVQSMLKRLLQGSTYGDRCSAAVLTTPMHVSLDKKFCLELACLIAKRTSPAALLMYTPWTMTCYRGTKRGSAHVRAIRCNMNHT